MLECGEGSREYSLLSSTPIYTKSLPDNPNSHYTVRQIDEWIIVHSMVDREHQSER